MVLIETDMSKLDNDLGKFSDPDKLSEQMHVGQPQLGHFGLKVLLKASSRRTTRETRQARPRLILDHHV